MGNQKLAAMNRIFESVAKSAQDALYLLNAQRTKRSSRSTVVKQETLVNDTSSIHWQIMFNAFSICGDPYIDPELIQTYRAEKEEICTEKTRDFFALMCRVLFLKFLKKYQKSNSPRDLDIVRYFMYDRREYLLRSMGKAAEEEQRMCDAALRFIRSGGTRLEVSGEGDFRCFLPNWFVPVLHVLPEWYLAEFTEQFNEIEAYLKEIDESNLRSMATQVRH